MKRVLLFAVAALSFAACNADSSNGYTPPTVGLDDAGSEGGEGGSLVTDAGARDVIAVSCTTTFRYAPPAGRIIHSAQVTGEWNAFAKPGVAMTGPASDGSFNVGIELPAGLVGYKLLLDGAYELDPGARLRTYVGGVENSAVRVPDCHVPVLSLSDKTLTRAASGQGRFTANVRYVDAADRAGFDPASVKATLRKDEVVSPVAVKLDGARLSLDAPTLADGKYSIVVSANDKRGKAAKPLRLVFWVENAAFDWHDAVIYMAMTDRMKDGDPTNNAPAITGVDLRASFQGGDFEGVRSVIASGALDQLGVRAIWLTPFQTNPQGAFAADDGVHSVTGYHGYWPTKAREVEPRLGGEAALKKLVKEAHAHGIRVLQDFVVNHVHKEHEYFSAHPEWFRTGCLCGTSNCDWTAHRLDCLFADYLPDVNWTVPAVNEQYGDDAVYWIDNFDLDGLRMDAVKHVEDVATINLSARIRDEFEAAGTKVFLTGETAMGWSDCGLACNQSQYDTISRYIGPNGLDGQFDFVLYAAVPYLVFDTNSTKGLVHADYWAQASGWEYPAGSIMTPYIGSHDTPRSVTIASYRGQDGAHALSIPGNKWSNIAAAPPDSEPYARHRLAMSWLMGLPGAPLVYYGDEYGEWGGADPNNRVMWRGDRTLSADEAATLALTRKLGTARRELVALRRGDYRPVSTTEDFLVFARQTQAGDVALVAINRLATPQTYAATLPLTIPLSNGTVLHDRLGGPDVTVSGGAVTLTLGARSSAILAP
jgi:glycosidase